MPLAPILFKGHLQFSSLILKKGLLLIAVKLCAVCHQNPPGWVSLLLKFPFTLIKKVILLFSLPAQ